MEFDAEKLNGKPAKLDRRLKDARQISAAPVFENLEAFSDWLILELEKLEAAYPDFSAARSFPSFAGR